MFGHKKETVVEKPRFTQVDLLTGETASVANESGTVFEVPELREGFAWRVRIANEVPGMSFWKDQFAIELVEVASDTTISYASLATRHAHEVTNRQVSVSIKALLEELPSGVPASNVLGFYSAV